MPSASGLGSSDALASVGKVAGHAPGGASALRRRISVRKVGSDRASAAGRPARGPSGEGRGSGRVVGVVVVMRSSHAGSDSRPVAQAPDPSPFPVRRTPDGPGRGSEGVPGGGRRARQHTRPGGRAFRGALLFHALPPGALPPPGGNLPPRS